MTKATNGPVDPTRDSQHEASGGPRREPDRLIRLLESWEHVNSDITKTLESQAALPPEEDPIEAIEGLVRFSLPALCRRICELGANASNAQPGISAEIMVCRENDWKEQVLRAVVYDAFPSYSLDRVISFRSGFWSPHIRSVHYGKPDDKALNRDVIAKALLVGRDLIEDVVQESSTSLESEGGVLSVYSILPPSLLKGRAGLRTIRPGTILAMTLRFYSAEAFGREAIMILVDKLETLKSHLDILYGLSIALPSARDKESDTVAAFAARINGGREFSLTELARACMAPNAAPGHLTRKRATPRS